MSQADLKHEWKFKRNSPLIRFYLWAWDADPHAITFCKLFWGILLSPTLLVLWPLATGAEWLVERSDARKAARFNQELAARDEEDEPMSATEALAEERPSFRERQLENVGEFFAKPRPRKVARIVGIAAMVIGGLALVGFVGWFVVTNIVGVLIVLAWLAGGFVAVGLVVGVFYVLDTRGVLKAGGRKAKTAGRFLKDGFFAVKTNTCPRIVIDKPSVSANFTVVDKASGPLKSAERKVRDAPGTSDHGRRR